MDGRAGCTQDRRFRALVLLATFASLRWGDVSALRRSDLDLEGRDGSACGRPDPFHLDQHRSAVLLKRPGTAGNCD